MSDIKQTNWADDEEYDSEEAGDEFGLNVANQEKNNKESRKEVSLRLNAISILFWERRVSLFNSEVLNAIFVIVERFTFSYFTKASCARGIETNS